MYYIPKIIYKIYINDKLNIENLDTNTKNAINSFVIMNPNYDIIIYDKNKCIEFIKEYYSDRELYCFNKLIPNAYKVDFMRYLLLYKTGGYYSDIKNVCLVSFDNFFPSNMEWFSCVEECDIKRMQNGFIGSIKGHLFLKKAIEKVIENIYNNYYGKDSTDITGPTMFFNCCNLEYNSNTLFGKFNFTDNKFYYNNKCFLIWKFLKNDGSNLGQGETINDGENNYNKLWKRKKIYN